jgi:2-hydroxychromene-2-carboxylate isomerase
MDELRATTALSPVLIGLVVTETGLAGVRIRAGVRDFIILQDVQACFGALPASSSLGTRGKTAGA